MITMNADVIVLDDLPVELRLQRKSDGKFFDGVKDGAPVFRKRWQDVSYFGTAFDQNGTIGNKEGTLLYQWNWQIDECGWDMSTLDMNDFRVHVVLGCSGY